MTKEIVHISHYQKRESIIERMKPYVNAYTNAMWKAWLLMKQKQADEEV
jgi:hypothetical protein